MTSIVHTSDSMITTPSSRRIRTHLACSSVVFTQR